MNTGSATSGRPFSTALANAAMDISATSNSHLSMAREFASVLFGVLTSSSSPSGRTRPSRSGAVSAVGITE